jgi:hypothetical protein
MKINVRSNASDVEKRVRELGSQVVFAAAVSLTRAVKDAQDAERKEMMRAFDRPTTYALNGTFIKAATKQNLEARLWVKDNPFGKGTPADRFLLPEIHGGKRGQKGMERALQAAGLLPAGWFAVPAAGAQLDGNGNVKRSQIVQILSQLQVQQKAGYDSKRSTSAASKRTVARQGVTYFALPVATRGLRPGIYLKRKFAHGSAIRPVFIFVSRIQYKPRFKFFEVGQAVAESRFGFHFNAEIGKAIASGRLGARR